jgi:hypothetical protein
MGSVGVGVEVRTFSTWFAQKTFDAPAIVVELPTEETPFYKLEGPHWLRCGNGLGWVYRTQSEFSLWAGDPTNVSEGIIYPTQKQIRVCPTRGDIELVSPSWYMTVDPDGPPNDWDSWVVKIQGLEQKMNISDFIDLPVKGMQ